MAEKFRLISADVRARACDRVLDAPLGHIVEIKEPTRTLMQNAKLHAMLTDISRQAEYKGKRRSVKVWKGIFVSGWQIATGREAEIIEGLEGELINIRESTATLGVRKLAEVIEYISAWSAHHGIKFRANEWEL